MKTALIILALILSIPVSHAQDASELEMQQKADSIRAVMSEHVTALKALREEHATITNQLNQIKVRKIIGQKLVCENACTVTDKAGGTKKLAKLAVGDEVMVVEVLGEHFKVIHGNVCGFVTMTDFNYDQLANVAVTAAPVQVAAATPAPAAPVDKRRAELIEKYGADDGNRIANKEVWEGMTEAMLFDSCGEPGLINESKTSWGVIKQCVYDGKKYINIENGIVTSYSVL